MPSLDLEHLYGMVWMTGEKAYLLSQVVQAREASLH